MENSNNNQSYRLLELGGSDYEIADNQPNIKGWTVKDAQGQTIGEVDELIFDPQARKVRYMVVDLEGNVLDVDPRDVLVPIGLAQLHESDDDVVLPQITAEHLRALPTYHKDALDRNMESSVRYVFDSMGPAAGVGAVGLAAAAIPSGTQDDFYDHHIYQEDLTRNRPYNTGNNLTGTTTGLTQDETTIPIIEENIEIGKREIETGSAHISSRIVERPVEEQIHLREEHVVVERTPVDRPATAADLNTFQEGEIELTEHAEVPIVSKEARVVEEITLGKEVEERDEIIRDTVRSTEVDIDNLDNTPRELDRDDEFPDRNPNRF